MAMIETLSLALAWLAGAALGAIYFGGLWWTIRRAVSSELPVLWFVASLPLRLGIALSGFYFVGRGHWLRLLLCLLGFVMARLAVTWLTRPSPDRRIFPAQEASVAP
jgi:F1F0 ATPase subunit 2